MHVPLSAQLPAAGTGWKWLLCQSAGAAADAGTGAAFGRDFNKTSAVWTVIDAVPEVAGSPSPAADFWRIILWRRLSKGARSIVLDIDVILCVRLLRLLSFHIFSGE